MGPHITSETLMFSPANVIRLGAVVLALSLIGPSEGQDFCLLGDLGAVAGDPTASFPSGAVLTRGLDFIAACPEGTSEYPIRDEVSCDSDPATQEGRSWSAQVLCRPACTRDFTASSVHDTVRYSAGPGAGLVAHMSWVLVECGFGRSYADGGAAILFCEDGEWLGRAGAVAGAPMPLAVCEPCAWEPLHTAFTVSLKRPLSSKGFLRKDGVVEHIGTLEECTAYCASYTFANGSPCEAVGWRAVGSRRRRGGKRQCVLHAAIDRPLAAEARDSAVIYRRACPRRSPGNSSSSQTTGDGEQSYFELLRRVLPVGIPKHPLSPLAPIINVLNWAEPGSPCPADRSTCLAGDIPPTMYCRNELGFSVGRRHWYGHSEEGNPSTQRYGGRSIDEANYPWRSSQGLGYLKAIFCEEPQEAVSGVGWDGTPLASNLVPVDVAFLGRGVTWNGKHSLSDCQMECEHTVGCSAVAFDEDGAKGNCGLLAAFDSARWAQGPTQRTNDHRVAFAIYRMDQTLNVA